MIPTSVLLGMGRKIRDSRATGHGALDRRMPFGYNYSRKILRDLCSTAAAVSWFLVTFERVHSDAAMTNFVVVLSIPMAGQSIETAKS